MSRMHSNTFKTIKHPSLWISACRYREPRANLKYLWRCEAEKVQTETKQGSPYWSIFTVYCMFLGNSKQTNHYKTCWTLSPCPRKSGIPCNLGCKLYAGIFRARNTRSAPPPKSLKALKSRPESLWSRVWKGLRVNFKAGLGLTGIVFFQTTPLKNVSSRFAVIRPQKEPRKVRSRLCPNKVNPWTSPSDTSHGPRENVIPYFVAGCSLKPEICV